MSSSDSRIYKGMLLRYLAGTLFMIVFAVIYEHFSHNVYSMYMVFSPVFSLVLGVLLTTFMFCTDCPAPHSAARTALAWSVVTLSLWALMTGVFEIFGSENRFTFYYLPAGTGLFILAVLIYIIQIARTQDVSANKSE